MEPSRTFETRWISATWYRTVPRYVTSHAEYKRTRKIRARALCNNATTFTTYYNTAFM